MPETLSHPRVASEPSAVDELSTELTQISDGFHANHGIVFPRSQHDHAEAVQALVDEVDDKTSAYENPTYETELGNGELSSAEKFDAIMTAIPLYDKILISYERMEAGPVIEGRLERAPITWGRERDGWGEISRLILDVKWDDLPLADANKLISEMGRIEQTREQLYRYKNYQRTYNLGVLTAMAIDGISPEKLRELYHDETGVLKELAQTQERDFGPHNRTLARVLAKVYKEDGLDRVEPGKDLLVDRIVPELHPTELAIYSLPEKPKSLSEGDIYVYDKDVDDRIFDALYGLELDDDLVAKFWLSARSRLMGFDEDDNETYLDSEKVADRLGKIWNNVQMLDTDRVEQLHKELGVINLDNYDSIDLRRLHKLLEKDPEYIRKLQGTDVTVVFVDGKGDYNGAFDGEFGRYRQIDGAMIPFEVSKPGDIYRRMAWLKKLGIKPSTIVIGAHGEPGRIAFGNSMTGFSVASTSSVAKQQPKDLKSFAVDTLSLDHFVEDYMQPNRGIDSTPDMKGRIQIILDSCSGDKAFNTHAASTAESILKRIGRTDVTEFAATDVSYANSDPDTGGVIFKRWDSQEKRTDEVINSALSLTPTGRLRRRNPDVIPIRRKGRMTA